MMMTNIDGVAALMLQGRPAEIYTLAREALIEQMYDGKPPARYAKHIRQGTVDDGLVSLFAKYIATGMALGMATQADATMEPLVDYVGSIRAGFDSEREAA